MTGTEGAAAGADGGIPEDGDDAEPSPSRVGGRKRGRKTNKSKADDAEDTLGGFVSRRFFIYTSCESMHISFKGFFFLFSNGG